MTASEIGKLTARQRSVGILRKVDAEAEQHAGQLAERAQDLEAAADADRAPIAELQAQALLDRDEINNLKIALSGARKIGAAIGIIMAVEKVTEDQAFTVLRRASQTGNRKLRDVAEDVLVTGAVPEATMGNDRRTE